MVDEFDVEVTNYLAGLLNLARITRLGSGYGPWHAIGQSEANRRNH